MSVVFKNEGLIDLTAVKTFGVSAKEGDNPIGYFSTGLKYALAIMLRKNIKFDLYRGKKKISFTVKRKKVRNDHFDLVCMNDEELGFTTDVGKNWDLWQAFRELHCNTTDEGGTVTQEDKPAPEAGHTMLVVHGPDFRRQFENVGAIVIDSEPLLKNRTLEVHEGSGEHIFYRGVRVQELSRRSLFRYNILDGVTLTEDRTVRYSWVVAEKIRDGLVQLDCRDTLFKVLCPPEGFYEAGIDFTGANRTPSDMFFEVAASLELSNDRNTNKSAINLMKKHQVKKGDGKGTVQLNHIEAEQLDKAVQFCMSMGYKVEEFPILVVDWMDEGILGLAENGTIFVAHRCFDLGTKFVAHAVLEEYIHLKEGFDDCTRELQSYLFKKIIGLGEQHVTGEAL